MDLRFAMLECLLANIWRDPKKGKAAKVEDFMLQFDKRPGRRMSAAEMGKVMQGAAKIFEGLAKAGAKPKKSK